jgi:hypothetical protein
MNNDKNVIIVSVEEALPDEVIEDCLCEPADRGYYLTLMLPPRDGKLRAVYKRSVAYVDPAGQAARVADDEKALAIVASHKHLTQVQVVALIGAAGIRRSGNWVGQQRALMAVKAGKIT